MNPSGPEPTVSFSRDDVLRFAEWSSDRNPLHVDAAYARDTHFGQQVVHGVLTVLTALKDGGGRGGVVRELDIEFRNAVVLNTPYRARLDADGEGLRATLSNGEQPVLVVLGSGRNATVPPDLDLSWIAPASGAARTTPIARSVADLLEGATVIGAYTAPPLADLTAGSALSATAVRVLGLCSYVTGMEVPGLKSLFTRLTVALHADAGPGDALLYRARTTRFDQNFRLLDTDLVVTTADGTLVATALLRSYVPFSPVRTDPERLAGRLTDIAGSLSGKVALVTGGSRGLGADLACTLALAGAHVYASARHANDGGLEQHEALIARGARLEYLTGDAGDPAWCADTAAAIRAKHGRLDLLILNACAPPPVLRLGRDTAEARDRYIRENLRLVESSLDAFVPALAEAAGILVFVSSSFVDEPPPGFGHYVAVKQAGEALVRTMVREHPAMCGLVARPPVLQTRWNDTPSGVVGSIPADWAASRIVNALAARTPGRVDVLTEFPAFADAPAGAGKPASFSLRVAASFTTDALVPALRFWAQELALDAAVEVAPYGQVLQSLLDPASVLNARGSGTNVVLVRVLDWLRELADGQRGDPERLRSFLQQTAGDFQAAVQAHRSQASSETLLLLCPSYGAASAAESILVRQAEQQLLDGLGSLAGLHLVQASQFHEHYGVDEDAVHDELRDHIAHIPYRDDYLYVLAAIAARHMYRRLVPARKVVVVDCDNTLWKGVVGEVGAEGVEFDDGHRALHAVLARLADSGVLVCLCSKNEEPDVWRVFDTRADFPLKREQVVAAAINWLPKSQNLRGLAGRLNLGLDSFIFIDDNPVECAEVRAGCPEVLTIQWPQQPDRAVQLLRHVWEFDAGKATREDARRTALYKEEFKRQELRAATLTFDDFIKNLQLEVEFAPMSGDDLRRSAQLTLRTNQFNFTTIRREEPDVQALAAGGRHEIRTVRVRDRFGDYGLVGLVIAERGTHTWDLDTFLLSCRVLGRGVEHRIVSDLGQMAAAAGARSVTMRVETTKRNTPARSFFESVVPAEYRAGDLQRTTADVPVEALAAVHFEPSSPGEVVVAEEGGSKSSAAPMDAAQLRRREERIARAAFELASGAAMRAAAEGRPAPGAPAAVQSPADEQGIAAIVHDAFATALRLSAERVAQVDQLEALGCDSLRIVEITVALSAHYPWLPSTLLFEHRSVSQIVGEIVRLSRPEAAETSAPAPVAAVRGAAAPGGDIAIVGIGVRCAGASSPDELWELLREGRTAVGPVPAEREHFLRPLVDERPHWAGLLENVGGFDPEFFGVSPREAEVMDPQLRLFLQVAWSALEDAGAVGPSHEPSTGVFAGVMYGDYGYRANAGRGAAGPYRCWEGFSLANRVSQLLDFHGPSFAVETACSSSGTALHLACGALKAGECKVAVVGGVNLILDPDRFASLGRLGILSARGSCEPFGADADGTVLGEGAGVVVLRPLADALARGDRIHGVIKGTGLSTGSGTVGFTAPNPVAQAEAIRRCLRVSAVDPRTVSYIETHGTGTLLGDPIEVRGLALAYADPALHEPGVSIAHSCALGSIKPNVGHLEAGAGILGLIKILLQFKHQALVPSRTSPRPSPQIPFAELPFGVQRELADWARPVMRVDGRVVPVPRRAGLNSFGVGGANAHLIVEEPPSAGEHPPGERPERPGHVLALSAVSEAALARQVQSIATFIEQSPDLAIGDACHAINTGRRHSSHRAAFVASNHEGLLRALRAGKPGTSVDRAPTIAFLFTGQGSQYAGMGRQLYSTQPVYRDAIDRCALALDAVLERPLRTVLFAPEGSPDSELLHLTGYTQPALFALQYALATLWQSWGVAPSLVMGHSVGEIAAMCVAGGLTLEDALTLVAARGRLMQALPPGGLMTSVMADEARVRAAIEDVRELVAIAAVNSPGQTVISGAGTAVAEISARLNADGISTKALTVSHAFHSPLMKPMLSDYERVVRGVRLRAPRTPLVTCVDGTIGRDDLTTPSYWLRQVMDPVRFVTGMQVLEREHVDTYVEIGPHPVLVGMGKQCVADESAALWVPSLRRGLDEWTTMLDGVARLYEHAVDVDWHGFDAPYGRTRVSVPAYAFSSREYWLKHVPSLAEPDRTVDSGHVPERTGGPEVYELAWQAAPAQARTQVAGAWLVLCDGAGVGAALADVLRATGVPVTTVQRAGEFAREAGAFQIDPDNIEHYKRLLAAVDAESGLNVVHLWGLDAAGNDALRADTLEQSLALGTATIAHLLNAASSRRAARATISVVTRSALGLPGDSDPVAVAQAPAWGFGRTAALEHPDIWKAAIDLEPAAPGEMARMLAGELLAGTDDDQVAIRRRGRFVARLVRQPAPAGVPALSAEGVYLVTGGLGALGLQSAEWLVARGARRLVLAGRAAASTTVAQAVDKLRARGVAVEVVSLDVSRADAVDSLISRLAAAPQPLRGVLHAAGVDATMSIAALTGADLQRAFAAKGTGAWLLHQATRALALDLFVCFSSVASILGAQGRAHYGAANAFLDALAQERRRLGLPITAINWGPWRGGGMATADHLQQFERIGNFGLEPAAAFGVLDGLVASGAASSMVAHIDWEMFRPAYESRRPRPVLAALDPVTSGSDATGSAAAPAWVERLRSVNATDRERELATLVQREVAETMGFDDSASVPLERNFFELGVDSLMMADLVARIRRNVGFSCSTLVFDHPTVRALSHQLLPRLPLDAIETPAAAPGATAAGPADDDERTVGYDPALEAEAFAFQAAAWPHRNRELIPARWRWMFVESARRLGVAPRVWLHRAQGRVVGHMGSIPVSLKVGSDVVPTGWLVDTMVFDDQRRRGLGSRLMVQAHEDQPFSLSLGQTGEMREIQLRLGWQQVVPLQVAQLLIRPEHVLRGKLPKPAALAAGLGLRASTAMRGLLRGKNDVCVKPVDRFGERHDTLWQTVSSTITCGVVRDAGYLNWKYVDQPGQRFERFEMFDGDRLIGVAVLAMREAEAPYLYRRALLVDVVASMGPDADLERVIRGAASAAESRGADAMVCMYVGAALTRALKANGFTLRDPERVLLIDTGGCDPATQRTLLDGSGWLVTQGDSDIDRPW
jgi:FkbH-like protein